MRGRPHVGMRNDNSFGSRSNRNDPGSFAHECTFAGPNMGWIEQNRGPAVRSSEVGTHLEIASEPKTVVLDEAGGPRQIRAAGLSATLWENRQAISASAVELRSHKTLFYMDPANVGKYDALVPRNAQVSTNRRALPDRRQPGNYPETVI